MLTVCSYICGSHNGESKNVLSVFIHPVPITDEVLDEAIAPVLAAGGPFNEVHFCGVPEAVLAVKKMFSAEFAIAERLRQTLSAIDKQVLFITWDLSCESGFIAQALRDDVSISGSAVAVERRFSLFDAFVNNNGIVTASRGTHFTKPSGSHALQFLRAANVLEKSAVSHQLAFWLYPLIANRTIKRLVVDTSGIAPIAYTLAYERVQRGLAQQLPIIESHASYGGLDDLIVSDPEHTIFLISASTSGSLANRLIEKGARPENIFTLFYLGSASPGNVLCDLQVDARLSFPGFPLIKNFEAVECPECKQHSYAIPIVGDQFRTEPARVEEITILLSDFDEVTRATLDKLVSTNLFKVFRRTEGRHFELYLDLENMMGTGGTDEESKQRVNEIALRLRRLLRRGMPVHLRRIIPTSYPGTGNFANDAVTSLPSELQSRVRIVLPKDLKDEQSEQESATLVVSGCMDDAYELMGISRDLRSVQPGGNITYVSPIFRASSDLERRRIESNLTFGDQGAKTFSLFSVIAIELPPCSTDHSWSLEYDRLASVQYWCDLNGETLPVEIEARLTVLQAAPAIGLQDNLFWSSLDGQPLRLAADFTMIPTRDGQRPVSQADVFAIVTSLFHKYRQGVKGKPKLIYRTHERTVISPESFQRFSDGILQAAFLRAARFGELAYGNCDEIVSERMYMFLRREVSAAEQGGGPALMEYLVALLTGRLTLHRPHLESIIDLMIASNLPDYLNVIARYLSAELQEV